MMFSEGSKRRSDEATKGKERRSARGVTFTEVMFAVVLLGIGFIMVAAIFPVAIRQSQENLEETAGVAVANSGGAVLKQSGGSLREHIGTNYIYHINVDPLPVGAVSTQLYVPSEVVGTFPPNPATGVAGIQGFELLKAGVIQSSDPRYAWIPVAYQCTSTGPAGAETAPDTAKVYLLAAKVRNRSTFTTDDLTVTIIASRPAGTFVADQVYFKLVEGASYGPDTLIFTDNTGNNPIDVPKAAEGAFVWVAKDNIPAGNVMIPPGSANGRCYRLSQRRTDLGIGVWELDLTHDMTWTAGPDRIFNTADDINENLPPRPIDNPHPLSTLNYSNVLSFGGPSIGLIVGRGTANPLAGGPPYEGSAMDLFQKVITVPLPR